MREQHGPKLHLRRYQQNVATLSFKFVEVVIAVFVDNE